MQKSKAKVGNMIYKADRLRDKIDSKIMSLAGFIRSNQKVFDEYNKLKNEIEVMEEEYKELRAEVVLEDEYEF